MDFESNGLSKESNAIQKEIATKKKVCLLQQQFDLLIQDIHQAKESADDLLAKKKDIDAQVDAKRKEVKAYELKMRLRASMVGNIVGKDVPVSQTEVGNVPHFIRFFE